MTLNILKDDTQKIACRSNVHPGDDLLTRNLRFDPSTIPEIIKSRQDSFEDDDTFSTNASTINDHKNYQDTSSMHVI